MNLNEAIGAISAPMGMTSLIAGLLGGDRGSLERKSALGSDLDAARERLGRVQDAQSKCQSDAAYWGYEGEIAYWKAVVSLHEAAALVGPDNLPDVVAPVNNGMALMDLCARVEQFGKAVLDAAKSVHAAGSGQSEEGGA